MEQQAGPYDFKSIEQKWQKYWYEAKTFKCAEGDYQRPKYYVLDMFPYPSGDGLHVGHPEGYTATDIVARFKRMHGFNVLHPMGWDAFGLPAEQHAVRTGTHPGTTTSKNIKRFRQQIQALGLSYDWDREIDTTSEKYYRWTQWIFLQLYERGLAYESYEPVNWCPKLGTVLANEEVIDGRSEVGGFPVVKKPMRQWVLKITEYAERLLEDLNDLDWPEPIKEMQRHWIGRSEGAEIEFPLAGHTETLAVFTTRPDTIFGATFMAIAPEHPLVSKLTKPDCQESVHEYLAQAAAKSERDRLANNEKTGVLTGAYAMNPVNQQRLPIFIADYVLVSYGKGAVMGVPGHDERDHAFACRYKLPIVEVVKGGTADIKEQPHIGDGELVNSDFLNGLHKDAAIKKIIAWVAEHKIGTGKVQYKLRDWLFSRQRYWGEPFPLVRNNQGEVVAVSADDLPVTLPALDDFKPTGDGQPPLTRAQAWCQHIDKDGNRWQRETNTMPQWAGSCWYYLRFTDPTNDAAAWDREKEKYWMPVDLYVGGAEHAVLHLLYARFWHKVLYDAGYVSTKEPFRRLVNQGMILGENGEKMSKSRGNVVNPDHVIEEWGADSMRLYEMFMGPLEASKPWNTRGISGCYRFLSRVWRLFIGDDGNISATVLAPKEESSVAVFLHKTIKKVTQDTENLQFNTAIAAMMEFVNFAYKEGGISSASAKTFVLLLSPYAPHLCEELWQRLGHTSSLAYAAWPQYDESMIKVEQITYSIQVNGKLRGTLAVPLDESQAAVIAQAKALPAVKKYLETSSIKKEIFVPKKIVNFVLGR